MSWKNKSSYPSELTMPQWRWEFLKRLPEYRKDWDKHKENVDHEAAQKYRLVMFIDPNENSPDEFQLMHTQPPEGEAYTLPWTFDLKKPIKPQLNEVEKIIKSFKNKGLKVKATKNKSNELWPLYLMILDAKEHDVSHRDIGEVLFPNLDEYDAKSKISKYLRRAKDLTKHFPL